MNAVMKKIKLGMERIGVRFLEEGRRWKLPCLLYAYDLAFCGNSDREIKEMVRRLVEVYEIRGQKVNVDKRKMETLEVVERMICEMFVDWM